MLIVSKHLLRVPKNIFQGDSFHDFPMDQVSMTGLTIPTCLSNVSRLLLCSLSLILPPVSQSFLTAVVSWVHCLAKTGPCYICLLSWVSGGAVSVLREVVSGALLSAVPAARPAALPTGSRMNQRLPQRGLCPDTRLPHRPLSIFNSTISGLLQSKLPLMVTRQTISSVCMSSKGRTAVSPFQFRDALTDCMEVAWLCDAYSFQFHAG